MNSSGWSCRALSRLGTALATVWLSLALACLPALAQGTASVIVRPGSAEAGLGQEVAIEVAVENAVGLYAAELHLVFDPALLEVVDSDPTKDGVQVALPGTFLIPNFVVENRADNAAGKIDIAFTQIAPAPPAEGSGVLAVITVRAKAAGAASIEVDSLILATGDADALAVDTRSEGLVVSSSAAPAAPAPEATATVAAVGGGRPTATLPAGSPGGNPPADTPTAIVAASATPLPAATVAPAPVSAEATVQVQAVPPTATFPAAPPPAAVAPAAPATSGPSTAAQSPLATPAPMAAAVAQTDPTPVAEAASPTVTPTATPAQLALAAVETPAAPDEPAALVDTAVPAPGGGFLTSIWFILAVVGAIIIGFALVVLPRGRSDRA